MLIRNATKEDLGSILDIFNYEVLHTKYVYLYEPWTKEYINQWYQEKQAKNFPLIVAEIEGAVVGYATYGKFRDRAAYDSTIEYSVYIHKNHRGKGLGYNLVNELIELAKKDGYHCMIGGLDADNKESEAFHKRMGFVEVAHMKQVARKFVQWLDLKFYQLLLD